MSTAKRERQVIKFRNCHVNLTQRSDGRWILRWREAGKDRATTAANEEAARKAGLKIAQGLADNNGSRLVSVIDAEAVEKMKGIIGNRSLTAVVGQLEDYVSRAGGWEHVGRAVENYLRAGHGKLVKASVAEAVKRFLGSHQGSAREYRAGLKKELQVFADHERFGFLAVQDVTKDILEPWISRLNEDGTAPGARYVNNRLDSWKTFLNSCRQWNMLVRDEPHAAMLIKRRKLEDTVPEIWTADQGEKILRAVLKGQPQCLNYLVIGCWLGLRPFEMHRLTWEAWDWERGYVDVGAKVARKTMQQRFVPIPDNVRQLLQGRQEDPRWGVKYRRKARTCVRSDDQVYLSAFLREKKLITEWPQDVMRHSYISYRLAQGHGRGQVAEWAGNSESEIRQSYRRPLRKEDGDQWFNLGLKSSD